MTVTRRTRAVLPFALLAALIGLTLLVHAAEQADPADPAYLSPVSAGDLGSDRLAAALGARGVTVDRRTGTEEALDALRTGPPATLFVPAPAFVDLEAVATVTGVPSGTRLVLVAPAGDDLARTVWPARLGRTRWAADVPDPGCSDPVARAAGPAAVLRHAYAAGDGTACYDGGLVTFFDGALTVTLAGAADPFRNDRIGEHGNEALATGLLAGTSRVVWLDLHREEPPDDPGTVEETPADSGSGPPAEPGEQTGPPGGPGTGTPGPGEPGEDDEGDASERPPDDNVLAEVFPPGVWAALLLAALALLALAAAAARRLGTPVVEPLPSRVPADETMLGHARLYQRARARGPSLDILRATARRRLATHFGLPSDASPAELAAHAGLPADHVRTVLAGDAPRSDEELVAAAVSVQNLLHEILHRPTEGDRP